MDTGTICSLLCKFYPCMLLQCLDLKFVCHPSQSYELNSHLPAGETLNAWTCEQTWWVLISSHSQYLEVVHAVWCALTDQASCSSNVLVLAACMTYPQTFHGLFFPWLASQTLKHGEQHVSSLWVTLLLDFSFLFSSLPLFFAVPLWRSDW